MVTIDQLRISDNGQSMFIDAHVNKASYFDDVYLKRITICTEDQVSEINPLGYGDDFIFQQDIRPLEIIQQVYDKVQILSEQQLLNKGTVLGGWQINYESKPGALSNYLSVAFSGKYSQLNTGYAPKLVVATNAFDPVNDRMEHPEVLFTVDGYSYEEKDHQVWRFNGKGEVNLNQVLNFYLYAQTSEETFELVEISDTDDINFLHFLWQVYSEVPESNQKEIHLVLNCSSFNGQFTKQDLSHNMFFVYIECDGTPASDTPCRLDEMTTLGVTFDYGTIYNPAMGYTRELVNTCEMPQNFIDFILNVNALKMSIETEHYVPAIGYWQWLMNNIFGKTIDYGLKPCGCHG